MSVYTRTGDCGDTDLLGGARAPKDAALLEVCGTLDELNALLGLARCEPLPAAEVAVLEHLQRRLFDLGAELVAKGSGRSVQTPFGPEDVNAIEQSIDRYEASMKSPRAFILPAGCRAAATLHLARAVSRRMERRLVGLARTQAEIASPAILAYANRLSDLLYVLARTANVHGEVADVPC
jgi:cob(I)alamin adenosyltransferase